MKIKLLGIVFVLAAFVAAGNAQSVVVTGKKVTYNRPKPFSEYKKTFTINYPKVKAATPALSKKIETAISYEKVLGLNLKDELNDTQWIEEADYKVKYNRKGVLCVELSMEGSGAYPSSVSKMVVVDIRMGSKSRPADVFINLAGLTALVRKAQEKERQDTIARIKKEEPDADEPEILFGSRRFIGSDLDGYELSAKGVIFHYDYAFPHVAVIYEPAGAFFYTWTQLKPYIKAGGLLSRMKR